MTSPVIPDATLVQPWAKRGNDGELVAHGGRSCLVTPADVQAVMIESTGQWLPFLAEWSDDRRLSWRKFELPATGSPALQGPAADELRLKLVFTDGARRSVRARLEAGLPRIVHGDDGDTGDEGDGNDGDGEGAHRSDSDTSARHHDEAEPAAAPQAQRWRRAADAAEQMIGRHIDLVTRLYDVAPGDPDVFWDGPAGGVAAWPLAAVVNTWRQVDRQDGPRPALVVKLARSLGPLLTDVCHEPRRELTRQRRLQIAGRVQEVDSTCLRWLARQPGASVAQKAGAKQRALGIARVEHADTLENRVVRDLLRRLTQACQQYMGEHQGHGEHERVAAVAQFRALVQRLAVESPIALVGELARVPQPNYVLQHDRRYRPLWRAYVLLIKQQAQQNQAWRWRHRVWSEACMMAILAAIAGVRQVSPAMRSDLLLRPEQDSGRFIDERTAPGRWDLDHGGAGNGKGSSNGAGSTLLFVDGRHLPRYRAAAPFPEELTALCPDAAIIVRDAQKSDKGPRHIMGLWTLLEFDIDQDRMHERCRQIDAALRAIRSAGKLSGLLIQPKLPAAPSPSSPRTSSQTPPRPDLRRAAHSDRVSVGPDEVAAALDSLDEFRTDRCRGVRLTLPLQPHVPAFESLLIDELELT